MDVSDEGVCITQLPDDLLSLIYQKLIEVCYEKYVSQTCHRFLDIAILNCKCLMNNVTTITTTTTTTTTTSTKSYKPDSVVLGRCLHRFGHFPLPSSISVLKLNHTRITDEGLNTLTKYSNKWLINVSLNCCHQITKTGIWYLKQNCPQLRVLKISRCDKVVGITWQQGFSETLTYLEANAHVLYPTTGFLSGSGPEYLLVFSLNNHLVENEGCGLIAIGSGIAKNLKILSIRKGIFTDECIMKISKGCPLLQELDLSHCSGIELPGWVSIGLHCQNLEILHLTNTKNLCDEGLIALGNCSKLVVLYMKICSQITLDGKQRFKIQRPDVKMHETFGRLGFPKWTW